MVIGGVSGYFYKTNNNRSLLKNDYQPNLFEPSYNKIISEQPFVQEYTNPDFGFRFQLNENWKGYKVFSEAEKGDVVSYYFCVKTTDESWQADAAGLACPLYISVVSENQWQYMTGDKPSVSGFEVWGSKDGYKVVAEPWTEPSRDLVNTNFDFNRMKDSFRW